MTGGRVNMSEWVRIAVVGMNVLVSGVDGDTLRLADGSLVRMKGYNTPELRGKCEPERVKARQARDRLAQILRDKDVKLTILNEECGHGRHCGLLESRGHSAAETLISEGLAERMDCPEGKCPAPRDWCQ